MALASLAGTADKNCWAPICREGFRFDGQRCESASPPNVLAASRYDPPQPLCRAGWHVHGQYCIENGCRNKPACDSGETYQDGFCMSNPTSFGYHTKRRASCDAGWALMPASGLCQEPLPISVRGHSALPCVDRGGPVTIYGENFGTDRGTRHLTILAQDPIDVQHTAWDDTAISFLVPARNPRIEPSQEYPVFMWEGRRILFPLVRIRICGAPE